MPKAKTFQDLILTLQNYWAGKGCLILQPYDNEMGAGTFHPATTLRALGPRPWNAAYVQPSRRPTDGRYGENPNRLQHYYQFQVILKPAPENVQELYLGSLREIGLDPACHDIRFVEDDWESPTLGAAGLGWEVWCDGMEVTQFTYFQQVGGFDCDPVSAEITYGLERLAMYVQDVEFVYDLAFNAEFRYGEVFHQSEVEFSAYNFERADTRQHDAVGLAHHVGIGGDGNLDVGAQRPRRALEGLGGRAQVARTVVDDGNAGCHFGAAVLARNSWVAKSSPLATTSPRQTKPRARRPSRRKAAASKPRNSATSA